MKKTGSPMTYPMKGYIVGVTSAGYTVTFDSGKTIEKLSDADLEREKNTLDNG
jgi:hypothetical protein